MPFDAISNIQVPLGEVVMIFVLFEIKHLLADFVLQTEWMAIGKQAKRNWGAPLAVHALTHALGTLGIALVANPALWWLALVDFAAHGLIDYGKGRIGLVASVEPYSSDYWKLFGADQQLHGLTHLGLAVALIAG